MLPAGLAAQPADRSDHHALRELHPAAQTVVRLVVGACACDLVRPRHVDPREDERAHRERWRRVGGGRDALIAAIGRHRLGAAVKTPPGGWPRALAAFVAEHARNAGETLYLLRFADAPRASVAPAPAAHRVRAAQVLAGPEAWLEEDVPVVVGP
jgi:hypothetical protein